MQTTLHLIITYRYLILFPIACLEGPMFSFLVGMVSSQGYLNPFGAFFILLLGDFIPDTCYYFLGRYGERKAVVSRYFGRVGINGEHLEVIKKLWYNHSGRTMFFSKLAYGLSSTFLVSAGLVKMPFKKFITYAVPVTFLQYSILMVSGYYFGGSFKIVSTSVRDIQYMVAGFILVAIGYYFLTIHMRRRLLDEEKREENKV